MSIKKDNIWSNMAVVCTCAVLCCFLWGSAFPGIKYGYTVYGIDSSNTGMQIMFAGARFTIAGILVIIIGSILYRRVLVPKRKSLLPIVHLSILQTTAQYFFFYVGLAMTTGVKSSIIEALSVFIALFVAVIIYREERLSRNKLVGAIMGFAGVVVIELWGTNAVNGNGRIIGAGEICILISTVAYAFSSIYIKKYSRDELPMILSGYQFGIGGVSLFVMGLIFSAIKSNDVSRNMEMLWQGIKSVDGLTILIYLSAVSAIAYTLWGILLKHNPVSRISVFGSLTPVFGVIISAIALNELRTMNMAVTIVALALVSVGTLVAQINNQV